MGIALAIALQGLGAGAIAAPNPPAQWFWCESPGTGEGTSRWFYTYEIARSAGYDPKVLAEEFRGFMAKNGWTLSAPVCHRESSRADAEQHGDIEQTLHSRAGAITSKIMMP